MAERSTQLRARRWTALWVRILSASLGGYALAVACSFALARTLPMTRAEASIAASLAAVLTMPAAAVWAFAAQRARDAFAGIAGATLILAALAWLIGQPA